ncbi:MAG: hypothetical protein ABSF33_02000 [Acidimicrobiales bacterium]|jgi:hypothetical protein
MDSTLTESDSAGAVDQSTTSAWDALLKQSADPRLAEGLDDGRTGDEEALRSAFRDELDDPGLVLSTGYIGPDRRASGPLARLHRVTFGARRSLLQLEVAVVAVVAALVAASILLASGGGSVADRATKTVVRSATTSATPRAKAHVSTAPPPVTPARHVPTTTPTPTTTAPVVSAKPAAVAPAPVAAAAPVAAPAPAPAPTTTVPPPPPPTAGLTPSQMGAQALALVRYPWQNIPGYSIQFLPIADAPSPGFYGNTTFTWGQTGGTSVLYVYPGETIDQLAGITAFEIGHEVDAAGVEPQGGEAQIENILGIHPASWAPNCDCAEQGFLSGWYASAFSNYWSPGVGDWSQVAPEPSGAVLAAVEPWLNPTIS